MPLFHCEQSNDLPSVHEAIDVSENEVLSTHRSDCDKQIGVSTLTAGSANQVSEVASPALLVVRRTVRDDKKGGRRAAAAASAAAGADFRRRRRRRGE